MDDEEKVWKEFWLPLIENEYGIIDLDKVKKELFDYHFLLTQVPKVYCEITGGLLSKTNYHAETIIQQYEENLNKLFEEYMEEECDGCTRNVE